MSVGFSAAQIAQLQAALKTLLSPLDFESLGAWRAQSRAVIAGLLRAQSSVSFLPLDREAPYQASRQINLASYAEHFHTMDQTPQYSRAAGSHAFTWETMRPVYERPGTGAWSKSEFYNDWVRPQRLCQPCGLIAVRSPEELRCPPFENFSGLAGLWFYWDRERPAATGARELAILQLLLPAFEAGLQVLLRCGREQELVASALGGLGDGAVLVNEAGRVRYENTAFARLLRHEPDAPRVQAACARIGRLVLALDRRKHVKSRPGPEEIVQPLQEQVRTTAARYRLRAAVMDSGLFGPSPMALVVLEAGGAPRSPSPRLLRERYDLTARELAVSYLLSEGRSNAEVAHLLGVSIHTARRHVEHVLMKLGLHSRAAVGAKLREDEGQPLASISRTP